MNRREFVAAGAMAGCGGIVLTGCIGFHYVNTTVSGTRLTVRKEDFGKRQFALVDVPGFALPLYLYRIDDNTYSAVSTRCMHRGCQVEPAATHLVCPCHGSEYTNSGEVLKGPTQQALRSLPVAVEADRIIIALPADRDQW